MNSTKPKSGRLGQVILALIIGALALAVAFSRSEINRLQSAQADLQQKLDAETKRAKSLAADAASWRKQTDSLLGQAGEMQKEAAATADKSSSKRNFSKEELATLSKNPALQSLIASQQSAIIGITYSALLDHFKLAPDERDYLEKLLMEKQMVQVNLGMQMLNASLSPQERGALGRQIQQGMQDSEAKIKTFLNDDQDYGYYQTYAQQEPERLEVGMFTQSVGGLDATTSEALATMLSDSRNSYPFTVNFYDHRNFGNPAVLNSAAINQFLDEQTKFQSDVAEKASTLLTPAQQEAFKQNQAAVRQMTKMQLNSIIQLTGTGQ